MPLLSIEMPCNLMMGNCNGNNGAKDISMNFTKINHDSHESSEYHGSHGSHDSHDSHDSHGSHDFHSFHSLYSSHGSHGSHSKDKVEKDDTKTTQGKDEKNKTSTSVNEPNKDAISKIEDTNKNNIDVNSSSIESNSDINATANSQSASFSNSTKQNNSEGISFGQNASINEFLDNNGIEQKNESKSKFPLGSIMIVVMVVAIITFFVIKKKRNEKIFQEKFENVSYNGKTNLFSNARAILLNDEYANTYENFEQHSFDNPTVTPEPPAPAYRTIEVQPIDPTLNNPYYNQNVTDYNNV